MTPYPRLARFVALGAFAPLALGFGPSLACNGNSTNSEGAPLPGGELRVETVATGLDTPWDIAWGPDDAIWVTERGGAISRVNPSSGQLSRVGQLTVTESGESGLMGMTFHPDFATQPYVYAIHSYSSGGGIRNRLVRLSYSGSALSTPETLIDNIPGGGIHDGARLAIGPDRLLYVSTGDAGTASLAQDRASLAGKILRVTLTGQPAPGNPFGTAIYSYGHRNPQGMVFHPVSGALYITEHGPGDNDEVNRIESGRNYGWPTVHGFCDDDVGSERTFCQANNVAEPLATWTPTIAPAGADIYNGDRIPEWRGSLVFTTLKGAALYRLTLSGNGTSVTARETLYAGTYGRLRDVLVAPDGAVYLATSNRDGRGSPASNDDRILRITR